MVIALVMVIGLVPNLAVADAPESKSGVSYLKYSWDGTSLISTTLTTQEYTEVTKLEDFYLTTPNTNTCLVQGTYYISEDVTIGDTNNRVILTPTDDVTLIIAPGKTLTINGEIEQAYNLIVYGQTDTDSEKGSLVLNHTNISTTALKGAALAFHGVNLNIVAGAGTASAVEFGNANDEYANLEMYACALTIDSANTGLSTGSNYGNSAFIYESDVKITIKNGSGIVVGKQLNIHNSSLAIATDPNATNPVMAGICAPFVLLKNCTGSIAGKYQSVISGVATTGDESICTLNICGSDTNLKIESSLPAGTGQDRVMAIAGNTTLVLDSALKLLDGSKNNAYISYPDPDTAITDYQNISIVKRDGNEVKPYNGAASVTINGVTLVPGDWIASEAGAVSGEALEDQYAYFYVDESQNYTVLELKNFAGTSILADGELWIKLIGKNTLTAEGENTVCGIYVSNGNLLMDCNEIASLEIKLSTTGQAVGIDCNGSISSILVSVSITVRGESSSVGIKANSLRIQDSALTIVSDGVGIDVSGGKLFLFNAPVSIQAGTYAALYAESEHPCYPMPTAKRVETEDSVLYAFWDESTGAFVKKLESSPEHNFVISKDEKGLNHGYLCTGCELGKDYQWHDSIEGCPICSPPCTDRNRDHICDDCSAPMGEHKTANGKHRCSYCQQAITGCEDSEHNGICDICGKIVAADAYIQTGFITVGSNVANTIVDTSLNVWETMTVHATAAMETLNFGYNEIVKPTMATVEYFLDVFNKTMDNILQYL